MKHLATTLIGALTFYAISPAGLAAVPDELRHQVVRFAELDLSRPAGAQELYRRIRRAAHAVCRTDEPIGYDRGCVDHAIARAVAEVGSPLLTAQHEALTPRPPVPVQQARLDR